MPHTARVAQLLSHHFMRGPIEEIDAEVFDASSSLSEAVRGLGVKLEKHELAFLNAVPSAQQAAIKGALQSALSSSPRTPVMFAWIPGFDFEVRLFEAEERGGAKSITLLFATPYLRARPS